jgi:hypothetical protein
MHDRYLLGLAVDHSVKRSAASPGRFMIGAEAGPAHRRSGRFFMPVI